MKQFNFTLTDETAEKLDKIKEAKKIANNAEAVQFLINEVFRQLFKEESSQ